MGTAEELREVKNNKTRVFIVDDHPIVRHGLAQLINQEQDIMVCGEAENAQQALKRMVELKPDIAIVDIILDGVDGIELMKDIKGRYAKLPVLVLSMHNESLYAERALRAGAKGYIMKHEATEKLVTAIRQVLRGEIYLSDRMAGKLLQKVFRGPSDTSVTPIECLTDRELEVFLLIGQGSRTHEIAEKLYLSIKTVESYRAHIKDKLKLRDATELIQHAIQWVQSEKID